MILSNCVCVLKLFALGFGFLVLFCSYFTIGLFGLICFRLLLLGGFCCFGLVLIDLHFVGGLLWFDVDLGFDLLVVLRFNFGCDLLFCLFGFGCFEFVVCTGMLLGLLLLVFVRVLFWLLYLGWLLLASFICLLELIGFYGCLLYDWLATLT